jgi:hypothetical protein
MLSISLKGQPVYKSVSIQPIRAYDALKLKEGIQAWLNGALSDPIVQILSKNSQLTKTQLETLLIDVLADNLSGKQLKYDEKARLRLTKAKISRGSFNRTLRQSKENVIKSLYTVLLLGYLGVFETTTLDPYLEIANKLHEYVEAHKGKPGNEGELTDRAKIIEIIREELETSLKRLSASFQE